MKTKHLNIIVPAELYDDLKRISFVDSKAGETPNLSQLIREVLTYYRDWWKDTNNDN